MLASTKVKALTRLLTETLRALAAFILGISALASVCYFVIFLSTRNNSVYMPAKPWNEVFYYGLANLYTGLELLLLATPIWLVGWLPLRLRRFSSASPWKISTTIFVAAVVGAVGGVLEGLAVFLYFDYIANTGHPPAPLIIYVLYLMFSFVIGTVGGALIGAAEILTSKWFKRNGG